MNGISFFTAVGYYKPETRELDFQEKADSNVISMYDKSELQISAAISIQRAWRALQTYKNPLEKLEVSRRLNQYGLTCLNCNPPLPKKQKIDTKKAELYLELITDEEVRKSAKNIIDHHIMHITMAQFSEALKKSCYKLNLFLAAHPEIKDVSVAYAPTKSQKWVAELALPHLSYYPQKALNIYSDDCQGDFKFDETNTDFLKKENHALLVFDDCSYTGTQIAERIIFQLWYWIANSDPHAIVQQHLIFVIPYMTTAAYEKIQSYISQLEEVRLPEDGSRLRIPIKVSIITHGIIPNIKQLPLTDVDLAALKKLWGITYSRRWESQSLTFGDWKIPDRVSIPNYFVKGLVPSNLYRYNGWSKEVVPKKYLDTAFIPEIKPPYKD